MENLKNRIAYLKELSEIYLEKVKSGASKGDDESKLGKTVNDVFCKGLNHAINASKSALIVIEELQNQLDVAKSALNYIKSSDNATISAQKALETIKILEK